MRNILWLVPVALLLCACDPRIQKFEVVPEQLQCPGPVTITWQGDADGGHLQADRPVTPPLPDSVLKSGTLQTTVNQTTTFQFLYPSAAHREKTVTCGSTSGPGPGGCGPTTLTFTGTCTSPSLGPSYIAANVSAAAAPGLLTQIHTDADFPVHVSHAGQVIPLAPGNGPLVPLPTVPAAGDYAISVPGDAGALVCAGSGPTSGSTEAPVVRVTITPTCPGT